MTINKQKLYNTERSAVSARTPVDENCTFPPFAKMRGMGTHGCAVLAAQVKEFDMIEWLTEENGAEALELFGGIGGVEAAARGRGRGIGGEMPGYAGGGGSGGIDDVHGVIEFG